MIMKKKSFSIALAALSCALATVFMAIGMNVSFILISGYIFAEIALMLPLAKNFRAGGFLAYVATALLCLPFGGIAMFYKLFPFIVFFGLHPLVNSFQEKWRINKWVAWAVKAAWFVGMLCASWALFSNLFQVAYEWLEVWAYPILIVGGAALFILYDWLMRKAQLLVNFYVSKVDRSGGAKGGKSVRGIGYRDDVDEVFGEMSPRGEDERKDTDGQSEGNNRGNREDRNMGNSGEDGQ